MKYITLKSVLIVLAILVVGFLVFPSKHQEIDPAKETPTTTPGGGVKKPPQGGDAVACTMDAKLCPDGSYVGRIGPKCEFKACPTPKGQTQSEINSTKTPPITVKNRMNEEAGASGITIRPTKIVEDSRCPVDVQCIQAGTVRLETVIARGQDVSNQILTLGTPFTWQGMTVTLVDVIPTTSSKKQLVPGDYLFTFSIVGDKM